MRTVLLVDACVFVASIVAATVLSTSCVLPNVLENGGDSEPGGQREQPNTSVLNQASQPAGMSSATAAAPSDAMSAAKSNTPTEGDRSALPMVPARITAAAGDRASSAAVRQVVAGSGGQAASDRKPPTSGTGAAGISSAGAGEPQGTALICSAGTQCDGPFNCIDRICVEPTPSCDHHKAANPESGDGIYWINPKGKPIRAYCDMQARVELCTEVQEEHHGVTKDMTMLKYTMTSVMNADSASCDIWAVRETGTNIPIGRFARDGVDICEVLGFPETAKHEYCIYGTELGAADCGFTQGGGDAWSGVCIECIGGGCCLTAPLRPFTDTSDRFYKYSDVKGLELISSFDGTKKTSCIVK